MRSTGFVAALILLVACLPAVAADQQPAAVTQYTLGDQVLSISAGPFFPLFFLAWDGSGVAATHLTVGGTGSISWAAYVSGQVRIGAEIGGVFAFSPNFNTLLMLPILAKAQYVFTIYPFEVPVGLAVGVNIVKYTNLSSLDVLLKPTASALWIFDSKWSFGLNLDWWWDMQFSSVDASKSRVANFLAATLSALYHY